MRQKISLPLLVCCCAASDPILLQQGVDVGNSAAQDVSAGWSSAGSARGCITLTNPLLPGGIFFFQKCYEANKSFVAATVSARVITGGGRLEWPCAGFACDPSGGTIMFERALFPTKTKNTAVADDNHGAKRIGPVKIGGHIGVMIGIAKDSSGVKVAITVYGRASLDVFEGAVHASGTISGIITFYGFRLVPSFGWDKVTFGVEVRVTVRIQYAEFHVACSLESGGSWTVSIELGHFFGIGNCFQKEWIRRRHWCNSYPRRRNHHMGQWCWGPSWWRTCGEYGSAPYPGCRYSLHPMCLNDSRRRRRRRTRRRRRGWR